MKALLISIRPEWVAKILNGEKTLEIRKTAPKCELPIDVYIYCTEPKAKNVLSLFVKKVRKIVGKVVEFIERKRVDNHDMRWSICNGKVVAKFTLKEVEKIIALKDEHPTEYYAGGMDLDSVLHKSRLSKEELRNYLKGKDGYAWYISDLQIFDEPMELREFGKYYWGHTWAKQVGALYAMPKKVFVPVVKPPQSWCYVEAKEE